ncbi:cupin domain-containing protein [Lascolabacillus massiliensis]|jgi:quercetin dioxygenase-like cupin family protein|uniref:cupin domain-containing protein n=1 Tax=Lascolabacillus massiliensis TaxID=1627894 RepID=UPI0006B36F32|nr:cupin domain-containing protein [Lascolabacillus massiliensis]OJV87672.1 MAG: cupin [Bacteroidia bacterium 44-10]
MNKLKVIFSACLVVIMTACSNKSGNNESTMESSNDVQLNAIFPKGEEISNNNFEGIAYLQWLMTDTENFDCTLGNVTFEPGCRNSWHSHPGGQILIVIAGEGYYQERGKPIQLIKKGDIIPIKPDVVHWHGATPDSAMEHLAIGTRSNMGSAVWYEPVSDEDYYSYKAE